MARERQVTRTIQATKVLALCINIDEQKPYDKEFIISGVYKDGKHLQKAIEKVGNTETDKVIHIKSSKVIETLYGMSEQKFIEMAEVLPPRNVK